MPTNIPGTRGTEVAGESIGRLLLHGKERVDCSHAKAADLYIYLHTGFVLAFGVRSSSIYVVRHIGMGVRAQGAKWNRDAKIVRAADPPSTPFPNDAAARSRLPGLSRQPEEAENTARNSSGRGGCTKGLAIGSDFLRAATGFNR
ncbi:unnamed protein product [Rhizoctonia solani]|uniref:Uncharacterized protein n=1 Tax=Rhizoctonia solani TaxID=456999 RepID=A0A8H3BHC8_9AGAM|nr:unnamed protein product [Rhizoctonia solani]